MILRKMLCAALFSAALQAAPAAFEVASVKADKTDRPRALKVLPGGRVSVSNMPLIFILAAAYNVPFQSTRLTGVPDWAKSEKFDIEATPAAGSIPASATSEERQEIVRQMLQTLLADRFKLTVRRETKEQTVYATVVGKGGPKLEPSKRSEQDCQATAAEFGNSTACHSITGGRGRGVHGEALTISDLVVYVANWTDHPVVDKTGLQGLFNIQTDGWLPMEAKEAPAADARGEDGKLLVDQPNIFEIFERLGLKLQLDKAPVETFVIERLERPSEN